MDSPPSVPSTPRSRSASTSRSVSVSSGAGAGAGAAPCSASLPPVIVHNYTIERKIGDGSFGEIFLGRQKSNDGRPVTVRTFRENHKSIDELDNSSIEKLSQLSHDNVAKILETVWHIGGGDKGDGTGASAGVELYLVVECCNKGDLGDYLQEHGKFSELEVQDFVRQMSLGMQVLRKRRIIHRDLKPSNILVEVREGPGLSEGVPGTGSVVYKIADLALTKLFFDDQEGIAFCDYPSFLAPEVLKTSLAPSADHLRTTTTMKVASEEDSCKIDLWSLGILLLYVMNNEVPFHGSDLSQYSCDKEIGVSSQIPKGTQPELSNLLLQLLRFDPFDRLDFTSLLQHPFLKSPIWFARPFTHSLPCSSHVTSLTCNDAQLTICGLESGLIEIFDENFRLTRRLDFHRKTVSALAVNKDIIISGSQDTTIAVWSRESFERMQVLYHHRNTVIGIEIIGSSAYSACLDGTHKAFSIDYRKLYARKNGFNQRRYSIQEHANEEFRENVDFTDEKTGRTYPAHWRDHDHMHTVAGVIVVLVYVAEDSEFRPFHVLSTRAFTSVRPQLIVRQRDDGNEHFVRRINFQSHVRQVQVEGDHVLLLHWDGCVTLWSAGQLLSPRPNDDLDTRTLVERQAEASRAATWFCARQDRLAYYIGDRVHLLEYKL